MAESENKKWKFGGFINSMTITRGIPDNYLGDVSIEKLRQVLNHLQKKC